MRSINRRGFLKTSVTAAAGLVSSFGVLRGVGAAGAVGANDAINFAVAGLNGRGAWHIGQIVRRKDCRITWLADPNSTQITRRSREMVQNHVPQPQGAQDIRKALEDKNLNAVSIATCNHWHALITIWACQAGKDVYVEKPCSHNVHEGRIAVEAARKYKRIVQHGTQSRANSNWERIRQVAASGKLGKLKVSHAFASKTRNSIGFQEPATPPKELDFNLWLGPAPEQPFHRNLVHYKWHWFWDTGNGEIGNQGVHQMDIARWGIPGATLPRRVISIGGRFGYEDQGQTPNTQLTAYDFGETLLVFEVCGLVDGKQSHLANDFHFEGGRFINGTFYAKGSNKPGHPPQVEVKRPEGDIYSNFVDCIRSRSAHNLQADILEAHLSSALCHLGNISYRLGKDVPFNTKAPFGDDVYANQAWDKLMEHLAKNRNLKLGDMTCRLGRNLKFHPGTERFVNDPEADALLTRPPREPFVVPERDKV